MPSFRDMSRSVYFDVNNTNLFLITIKSSAIKLTFIRFLMVLDCNDVLKSIKSTSECLDIPKEVTFKWNQIVLEIKLRVTICQLTSIRSIMLLHASNCHNQDQKLKLTLKLVLIHQARFRTVSSDSLNHLEHFSTTTHYSNFFLDPFPFQQLKI